MKSKILLTCCLGWALLSAAQNRHSYKVVATYHIASPGWWDYIAVNKGKLYVSHGTQVNILNEDTGDSIGVIPKTEGVHGIAFDNQLNKGYTSNGRLNTVTVFDLNTNEVTGSIATGQNPDAIMYEPYSKTIITCNERSRDLSIIDPAAGKVVATVNVGGKPETAVSDGKGRLFVNIEDKSEIVALNTKDFKVVAHWPLAPGTSPTGLAIDPETNRLFSGCDNKLMIVMDAASGKIVDKLPIGEGCDGVVFDRKNKTAFSSNGEGTVTAVMEKSANVFTVLGNFPTKRGARTCTVDENTGTIFLPTADFEHPAKQGERPAMIPGSFQVLVVR